MSGSFLVPFAWGALAFFLIGIAYRAFAIARLPAHLRWELAPIPHEAQKAGYGGSYLEEFEWWDKARKKSVTGPLLRMAEEIFFLRGVWKHNRSLWPSSMAMHAGIYLSLGALVFHAAMMVGTRLMEAPVPPTLIGALSITVLCAYLLGAGGTIGLLLKRLVDPNLRWSNSTGALVNLLFLFTVFGSGIHAWFRSPNAIREVGALLTGVLSLHDSFQITFPLALHATLILLLAVYLPFTGMVHFVAKYFTYHRVLWNDDPMDERLERQFAAQLSRTMGWQAKHAGTHRTWADLAKAADGDEKTNS